MGKTLPDLPLSEAGTPERQYQHGLEATWAFLEILNRYEKSRERKKLLSLKG